MNVGGTGWYDGKATKVMITGLASQKHTFIVRAVATKNLGTESEPNVVTIRSAIAKTSGAPLKYDAVKGFKVTEATANSIKLRWDASSGADRYRIEIWDAKGKEYLSSRTISKDSEGKLATETTFSGNWWFEEGPKFTFFVYAGQEVKVGAYPDGGGDIKEWAWSAAGKTTATIPKVTPIPIVSNATTDSITLTLTYPKPASGNPYCYYYLDIVVGKEEPWGLDEYDERRYNSLTDGKLEIVLKNTDGYSIKPGTKYTFIVFWGMGDQWGETRVTVTTPKLT